MKIAVLPNLDKKQARYHTLQVIEKLQSLGVEVLMEERLKTVFEKPRISFLPDFDTVLRSCDMVIAIGGDGTIIHFARHAAEAEKPLLGVNIGRLGFVAELEPDEINELDKLAAGEFQIENRMMLQVSYTENGQQKKCHVLNDAVVSRNALSPMPDYKVGFRGMTVCNFRGDGLIVATPTGSTAYSLSAGGPIIDPKLECIILSPVCSHSLLTRPVVFGPDAVLSVQAGLLPGSEVYLTMDGQISVKISDPTQKIFFSRSNRSVQIVHIKEHNFYEIVNEKLGNGRNGI